MISATSLVNADTVEYIKTLPDNCIDLIATDPPYYRVKACSWDNQWKTEADYLAWLDALLAEFWRVLKPNGSMYIFCGSRLASDTELLVRQRFDVLSHIIWAKPSGPWKRQNKESLRKYFPATERIIFAGHYPGPYQSKDKHLRRHFSVTVDVPYTDVWTYPPVQYYPGKHPCEKPAAMMAHIISASSRPGEVVADFFMGSGSTIKEAIRLGRIGLGVELEKERFDQTFGEIYPEE
ncbi:DNA-methyltransferase [Serratia sp. L9]|uniref:DNA-methyltransferase n=1 Tax=Serratia sp. L9 TaxID=3423946 RepID=UPI003D66F8A7